MPVSVSVVEMEVEILTFCPSCCCVGANTTISHVTVTGTDGGAGGGLQLTLYTYSARWLTEVSLSLTKSTLGIYQPPTSHTNRNILHSHYVIPNTKHYVPHTKHYTLDSPLLGSGRHSSSQLTGDLTTRSRSPSTSPPTSPPTPSPPLPP